MSEFRLEADGEVERLKELAWRLFVPSKPITIPTALRGRTRQIERTLETLHTPGRCVFIFGERGVGKTSLAQTAALLFTSSEVDPIFLACTPKLTFGGLVTQIV